MRIATYNVEWFDALFDRNANPLIDQKWSSRYNVTRADQWHAVGQVMRAMMLIVFWWSRPPITKQGAARLISERFADDLGCAPRTAQGLQMTRNRNWRSI